VPPACESLHLRMRSCAWFRPLSPASFGPFRRRNGRRQVPSPNVLATELGTTAPHPPSLRPYEFRDRWGRPVVHAEIPEGCSSLFNTWTGINLACATVKVVKLHGRTDQAWLAAARCCV
jgi:hypothetical protein